jgi:hypothetical protein
MRWIDIGVTLLLTLRIALWRPALPQLVDSSNDALLPEGKMNDITYSCNA